MNAKTLRTKLGLNQTEFWGRVGVRQSAGARYERGSRKIPRPVMMLLVREYQLQLGPKFARKDVESMVDILCTEYSMLPETQDMMQDAFQAFDDWFQENLFNVNDPLIDSLRKKKVAFRAFAAGANWALHGDTAL